MRVVNGLTLCGSTVEAPGPGWVSAEGNPCFESRGEGCQERKGVLQREQQGQRLGLLGECVSQGKLRVLPDG